MTVESDYANQARRAGAGTAGQGRDGSGEATLPEAPEPASSGATVSPSERASLAPVGWRAATAIAPGRPATATGAA